MVAAFCEFVFDLRMHARCKYIINLGSTNICLKCCEHREGQQILISVPKQPVTTHFLSSNTIFHINPYRHKRTISK